MIFRRIVINRPDGTIPDLNEEQTFVQFMAIGARIRGLTDDERASGNFEAKDIGAVFVLTATKNARLIESGWQVEYDGNTYDIDRAELERGQIEIFGRTFA